MSEIAGVNFSHISAGGNVSITLNGRTFAPSHKSKERFTAHPTVFVPRKDIYAHLTALLASALSTEDPFALVIRGPRGSGKTTLAEDICEQIRVPVHRLIAGTEFEPTNINADDLVFVDAFLENTSRDLAEVWLRRIKAKYFVITTRLPEGAAAIRSILFQRGGTAFEHELAGLTRHEFEQAIQNCRATPGCDGIQLSEGDTERLFHAMGGLPMAVQLLYKLAGSPIVSLKNFLILSTLAPEDALAELIARWRNAVANEDLDLHAALFTMANVPMLGISLDALADVLGWQAERIVETIHQLWDQGLISQVSPNDSALKLHDAIRDAFIASELEVGKAHEQRGKYSAYCRSDTKSKSRISMVDSMLLASEALFGLAKQDYIDAKPVEAYLIFLELRKIQENIIGHSHSNWQAEKLAQWLCEYVNRSGSSLKCNELIAIGGIAQSLPIALPALGDSFAPLWERGIETDSTKVTAAMLASIRHWRDSSVNNGAQITKRIEGAFERQPWHAFGGTADIVAAGFAAAHAMIGQFGLGAAYLSGWRIREKGISYREGFAVLLLSLDNQQGPAKANEFLHYHGAFCREVDPVTAAYLHARGIECANRYVGSEIEENLNRQALWGVWSDNQPYCRFVEHVLKLSTKRSDHPPLFVLSRSALDDAARMISTN